MSGVPIQPHQRLAEAFNTAQQCIKRGLLAEAKACLEQAAALSGYSHEQSLIQLAKLYALDAQTDAVGRLWKTAAVSALIEKREADYLRCAERLLKIQPVLPEELLTALDLYAAGRAERRAAQQPVHCGLTIGVAISGFTAASDTERLCRGLAGCADRRRFNLCFYCNKPEAENQKGLLTDLAEQRCKTITADARMSLSDSLSFFLEHIRSDQPDVLLYQEPAASPVWSFVARLKLAPRQAVLEHLSTTRCADLRITNSSETLKSPVSAIEYKTPLNSAACGELLEELASLSVYSGGATTPHDCMTAKKASSREGPTFRLDASGAFDAALIAESRPAYGDKNGPAAAVDAALPPAVETALDHLNAGRPAEALEGFNTALLSRPKSTAALFGRAAALARLEDTETAIAALEELLSSDPEHPHARALLAELRPPDAAPAEAKDTESKQSVEARLQKLIDSAVKSLRLGDCAGARAALIEAESSGCRVRDLAYVRALCHLSVNELPEARWALADELSAYPDNRDAYALLTEVERALKSTKAVE